MTEDIKRTVLSFLQNQEAQQPGKFTSDISSKDWTDDEFYTYVTNSWKKFKRATYKEALLSGIYIMRVYSSNLTDIDDLETHLKALWSWVGDSKPWFPNLLYDDKGSSLTLGSLPNASDLTKPGTWTLPASSLASRGATSTETTMNVTECCDWAKDLFDILADCHAKEDGDKESKALGTDVLNLITLISLTFCRLMCKPSDSVGIHIFQNTYKRYLSFCPPNAKFSKKITKVYPPTLDFCELFKRKFDRTTENCISIMIQVLHLCFASPNSMGKTIAKTCCVLSMSYNGLAFFHWLEMASKDTKLRYGEILERLYFPKFSDAIQKYVEFTTLQHQKTLTNGQKKPANILGGSTSGITWIFCRMFNDEYLSYFRVNNHSELVATFMALYKDQYFPNHLIWQSAHATQISIADKLQGIKNAYAIRMILNDESLDNAYGSKAQKVATTIRGLNIKEILATSRHASKPIDDDKASSVDSEEEEQENDGPIA